jgi:hypothetical protein
MKNPLKNEIEAAKRVLEKAVSAHKDALRPVKESIPESDRVLMQFYWDVIYTHPNAAQVNGYIRRAEKLATHLPAADFRPLLDVILAASEEVARLKKLNAEQGAELQRLADERKAETPARKAARELGFTEQTLTFIAQAMAPTETLLAAAYEKHLVAQYRRTVEKLAADGWDARISFGYPDGNMSRANYEAQKDAYNYVNAITVRDDSKGGGYGMRDPRFVKLKHSETEMMAKLAAKAAQMAKDALEAFTWKLSGKVQSELAAGDAVSAATYAGVKNPWNDSFIHISTTAGGAQCWKTKMILNFSVYGKPFNQWPTTLESSKGGRS